jgi:ribosomal-protein-alanine N-acetyltransferase
LRDWSIERGAHNLWLEVRASNLRALQVYQAHGFTTEGLRRDYYPVHMGRREDAVVMSLQW